MKAVVALYFTAFALAVCVSGQVPPDVCQVAVNGHTYDFSALVRHQG